MKSTRRRTGYIVDICPSRTAGFYAIAKDSEGTPYFCYGKSFLTYPTEPKIGHSIEFTVLPPGLGPLQRAIEIVIQRSTKGGDIAVGHSGSITRMILKSAGSERVLGELKFVAEMELK
jgi:hypothetical protein